MKISKHGLQPPEIERVILTEARYCADIHCMARHTEEVECVDADTGKADIDQAFRRAGWSDRPFLGQHLCPTHARGATVRMGAYRDVD